MSFLTHKWKTYNTFVWKHKRIPWIKVVPHFILLYSIKNPKKIHHVNIGNGYRWLIIFQWTKQNECKNIYCHFDSCFTSFIFMPILPALYRKKIPAFHSSNKVPFRNISFMVLLTFLYLKTFYICLIFAKYCISNQNCLFFICLAIIYSNNYLLLFFYFTSVITIDFVTWQVWQKIFNMSVTF